MSEVSSPQGVGSGGGGGGGGGGAQTRSHWLWQPVPQYASVLPQQRHSLQQRQLGQRAPPAWLPHCCAEAQSMEAKEKMIQGTGLHPSLLQLLDLDEVRVGYV
ncbi:hypothetical protein AAC387_Pa04g1969 [Persea americana]